MSEIRDGRGFLLPGVIVLIGGIFTEISQHVGSGCYKLELDSSGAYTEDEFTVQQFQVGTTVRHHPARPLEPRTFKLVGADVRDDAVLFYGHGEYWQLTQRGMVPELEIVEEPPELAATG
jgi:hypothetical protein